MRKKVHACHFRHPLVNEEQRDGVLALSQFLKSLQSTLARIRPQNAVPVGITLPKITVNGAEYVRIIVDNQ
jgi:hypothetical protein